MIRLALIVAAFAASLAVGALNLPRAENPGQECRLKAGKPCALHRHARRR